uniref:Uncharacterized protein n=1 Tax=Cucumis melo TaxID=3656 RepID=A0A9I9EJD9_CUCME
MKSSLKEKFTALSRVYTACYWTIVNDLDSRGIAIQYYLLGFNGIWHVTNWKHESELLPTLCGKKKKVFK